MIQLSVVCLFLANAWVGGAQMDVVHSWRAIDFTFPSSAAKEAMIRTGRFIPKNIALIDVDVWEGHNTGQGQKVFVTMPRLKQGTPATLATVGLTGILTPYPDWTWHREGDCNGITSVFRIDIDQCGRLWVLDSGVVDVFAQNPKMICPPQIHVFNLLNDKLIGRYVFPNDVVDNKSLLVTIVTDARDSKCQDTFAYIADVVNFKLIVFDANNQKSWQVSNNYFYPYPLHGSFNINGVNFDLMDGILGLAIGPLTNGDRRLYFHSLASVRESWVATSILRNSTIFSEGDGAPRSFYVSQSTRPSQSAAEAMSHSGVLFFGLLGENAIACWNSRLSYSPDNIIVVAKDDETLQFASGLKVKHDRVWVLTSRLQNYIVDAVTENEKNYRILSAPIDVLTKGTKCEVKSPITVNLSHYTSPSSSYSSVSFRNTY
ncbi:protein yellow-like isoform X2 [Rhodnius prolixus]|uniref:protein yellow-like isoform X2 n=1 Tax=Rhodnius prolixus TaxID=13249 RepID=UPI003D18CD9D